MTPENGLINQISCSQAPGEKGIASEPSFCYYVLEEG